MILTYYRDEATNFVPYRSTLNGLTISDPFLFSFLALRISIFSVLKYFNPIHTRVVDNLDVYYYDESGVINFLNESAGLYRDYYRE